MHDISVTLGRQSIDYPGDTPYVQESTCTFDRGDPFRLSCLRLSAHAGSHVDLPAHFIADGATVDQVPVERFIVRAQVVDIEDRRQVRAGAIEPVDVMPGEALLFRTDNSRLGRCRSGVFTEDYVYLAPDAAELCVSRGVGLVGIDYITIERYGAVGSPVHRTLLGGGCLILEGIDLSRVAPGRYDLICLPLRLAGCEASPVRAILLEGPDP